MNFDKHFNEYDNYSFVQKKVAYNLLEYMKKEGIFQKDISTVLEVGCGTGIFTRKYIEEFNKIKKIKKLYLNDKYDTIDFLENIEYDKFIRGDILSIDIPKNDLTISSSVFQWIDDIDKLFKNISNSANLLCFSTYIVGNLIEIKNHFGVSLNYKSITEIKEKLKKYYKDIIFYSESINLDFETPKDVLKHLKYTGVTGIQKPSIINIRNFKDKSLTYEVVYFICKK